MRRSLNFAGIIVGLLICCLPGCVAEQSGGVAKTSVQSQNVFSLSATILKSAGPMLTLNVNKPQLYIGEGKLALKLAQGIIDNSYLLEGKNTFLDDAEVKIIRVSGPKVLAKLLKADKVFVAGSTQEIYLDRKTIAIKDFEVIRGNHQEVARYVQEDVTTALVNSGQFNVVERMKLATVLSEIKLSQVGLVDPATAKQAGKLLGADLILTGTFVQIGDDWNVNLRLVNTETGLIVTAINRVGPLVEFTKEAIRDTAQIAGTFEEGQKLSGWIMGEKLEGRTGKGGFRKVSVDRSNGAKMTNRSLVLNFKLGLERVASKQKKNIFASLTNNLNRDLSLYKGISFQIKASAPMTIVFSLFDAQKASAKNEQWLLPMAITDDWQRVDIDFRSLTLKRKRAKRLGTDGILELHLVENLDWIVSEKNVPRGTEGMVWLDEVRFY